MWGVNIGSNVDGTLIFLGFELGTHFSSFLNHFHYEKRYLMVFLYMHLGSSSLIIYSMNFYVFYVNKQAQLRADIDFTSQKERKNKRKILLWALFIFFIMRWSWTYHQVKSNILALSINQSNTKSSLSNYWI